MSLELNGVEFAGVDPATGRWGTPILTHETNKTRMSLVHLNKPRNKYIWERAILTNCNGAANITRAIEENSYPVETVKLFKRTRLMVENPAPKRGEELLR